MRCFSFTTFCLRTRAWGDPCTAHLLQARTDHGSAWPVPPLDRSAARLSRVGGPARGPREAGVWHAVNAHATAADTFHADRLHPPHRSRAGSHQLCARHSPAAAAEFCRLDGECKRRDRRNSRGAALLATRRVRRPPRWMPAQVGGVAPERARRVPGSLAADVCSKVSIHLCHTLWPTPSATCRKEQLRLAGHVWCSM